MNMRVEAKEKTRQKAIEAARKAFAVTDYHAVSMRDLAKAMGMSTGAIFANFTGKADLWRASMPLPVPADDHRTRAADMLLKALVRQTESMAFLLNHAPIVQMWYDKFTDELAEDRKAIELAMSPLDGDAWARHLAAKAGFDAPRSQSPQAASLAPSDDAAAQA